MPMKDPAHPGEILLHAHLEPLGISVAEAADAIGVSRWKLSQITKGRARITPEIAIRISKGIGGRAALWYDLQAAWDMAQAEQAADQIKIKRCAKAA